MVIILYEAFQGVQMTCDANPKSGDMGLSKTDMKAQLKNECDINFAAIGWATLVHVLKIYDIMIQLHMHPLGRLLKYWF